MPFERGGNVLGRIRRQFHDETFVGGDDFARQFFLQIFITQPLPPERLRLVQIFRIIRVAPVERDFFVRAELEFLVFQQVRDVGVVLLDAFGITIINRERRRQICRAVFERQLVEVRPVNFKTREVALKKILAARVERINVAIKKTL